jgi:hypothetical protein
VEQPLTVPQVEAVVEQVAVAPVVPTPAGVERVRCNLCHDNKTYDPKVGMLIHKARAHKTS